MRESLIDRIPGVDLETNRAFAERVLDDIRRAEPYPELAAACEALTRHAEEVMSAAERVVTIGLFGEYNTGKSLTLGTLVGNPLLLPVQSEPATANITRLRLSPGPGDRPAEITAAYAEFIRGEEVPGYIAAIIRQAADVVAGLGRPADADHIAALDGAPDALPGLAAALEQVATSGDRLVSLAREVRELHEALRSGPPLGETVRLDTADPWRFVAHPSGNMTQVAGLDQRRFRSLVRQVVLDVSVPAWAWDLQPLLGAKLHLVDIPGRGSQTFRDGYVGQQELEKVTAALAVVSATRASANDSWEYVLHDGLDAHIKDVAARTEMLRAEHEKFREQLAASEEAQSAPEGGQTAREELFRTGARFRLEGDELVLRSGRWLPMQSFVTVMRHKRTGQLAWCGFNLDSYLEEHPEQRHPDLDPDELQRDLCFQVEATPELDMRILLCAGGVPLHLRPASAADVGQHVRGWFPAADADQPESHDDPDFRIVVNPGIPGSTTGTADSVVFSRPAVQQGRIAWFVSENAQDGDKPSRGVISDPLPTPGPDGWRFYLRDPGQPEQEMPQVAHVQLTDALASHAGHRLRERAGTPPLHTAVLYETGHLAVYSGQPPFRAASSLEELRAVPGSVLTAHMPSAQGDYHSPDDPFSGQH